MAASVRVVAVWAGSEGDAPSFSMHSFIHTLATFIHTLATERVTPPPSKTLASPQLHLTHPSKSRPVALGGCNGKICNPTFSHPAGERAAGGRGHAHGCGVCPGGGAGPPAPRPGADKGGAAIGRRRLGAVEAAFGRRLSRGPGLELARLDAHTHVALCHPRTRAHCSAARTRAPLCRLLRGEGGEGGRRPTGASPLWRWCPRAPAHHAGACGSGAAGARHGAALAQARAVRSDRGQVGRPVAVGA